MKINISSIRKYAGGVAVATLLTLGFAACKENEEPVAIPGSGVDQQTWVAENPADIAGGILAYEFNAAGNWTATSDSKWCQVLSKNGIAGESALRIKLEPNEDIMGRDAVVTIKVENADSEEKILIRQGIGIIEKGEGRYREVNKWLFDFMCDNYLWNEQIPNLPLDYSLDYQKFLTSMLEGVATKGDANHDDGYYKNGVRQAFFTYIDSKAPVTRATGNQYNDSGILKIQATQLGTGNTGPIGFVVVAVTPNTEASRAGLKRGDFINKVNNIEVTATNYQTLARNVYSGNCIVEVNDVTWADGVPTLHSRGNVQYSSSEYVDPSVYKTAVMTADNGKKVGYLLYMGFNMTFDDTLIDAFKEFKSAGIDELVLDLRFNNGGHVLSSTVMGTLIAGAEHKGKVYVKTSYNARRTMNGEQGVYKIGEPSNPESSEGYAKISEALQTSLGLNRLYVITSGTTASAAEIVINGLRGLNIDVRLVGVNTMGKNVGMEGVKRTFYNYPFLFYPVTFYCENAMGFRKYSGGFKPDYELNDANTYPGDFATAYDPLSATALQWAATGTKPQPKSVRTRGAQQLRQLPLPGDDAPISRHPSGAIQMRRN